MKPSLSLFSAVVLSAALLPNSLSAATSQYHEEAPSGAIVSAAQPHETKYGSISWKWTTDDDRIDVGQTFSSNDDFMLEKITLFTPGASPSELDRPFSVVIEEFDNDKADSPRTVIATESAMLSNLSVGGKYFTITLENPVPIRSATTYGFKLVFDSAMPTANFAFRTIPGIVDKHFTFTFRHESDADRLIPSQQNLDFWLEGSKD